MSIEPIKQQTTPLISPEPYWSATTQKVKQFLTSLEGGIMIFAILSGSLIALAWNIPIGLLFAVLGTGTAVVMMACKAARTPVQAQPSTPAKEQTPAQTQPPTPAKSQIPAPVKEQTPAQTQSPTPAKSQTLAPVPVQAPTEPAAPKVIFAKRFSAADNVAVYQETMKLSETKPKPGPFVIKNEMAPLDITKVPPYEKTKIYVTNKSTMRTSQDLKERGLNPLVLDMANAYHAGGGVRRGANAQEEILCRQSNLMPPLLEMEAAEQFPIPEKGGVLIPNVTFFRADPNEGYALLEKEFAVDVYALAAYCCILGNSDRPESDAEYRAGMKAKIETYLRTAVMNGNDSIVSSALGCGAFQNDPTFVANLFKEILNTDEFKGQFKEVAFGIIEDENSHGNYQTFKGVLK